MADYIIRAMAADYNIRAYAATTRDLVETARSIHNTSPVATAALGRALTAGAMMGSMMKGNKDILTLYVRGDGPLGSISVTADSRANVKGYVNEPNVLLHANSKGKLDVAKAIGKGELCVIKDVGLKEPYIGRTKLISGEIAEDLTYYYAVSEQVPTAVALGVLMNKNNTVRQAGGFILQLMPKVSEEITSNLEKKIAQINSVTALLDEGKTPEQILQDVLGDLGLSVLDRIPTKFYCDCSKSRVERAVVSIGEQELQSMIEEQKPIEVKCHFCNRIYCFEPDELKQLLREAKN